jgi:predicted TIM-barrel fold metal-dependent hydrolase
MRVVNGVDMVDIQAIDTRCPAFYVQSELAKSWGEVYELKQLTETTFAGVKERMDIEDGEEWKVLTLGANDTVDEAVNEMDEVGVQKLFIDDAMQWSYHHSETTAVCDIDTIGDLIQASNGRFVGGVGYDPYSVEESLARVERAIEDLGFSYVWFHPITYGLEPTDERCYPLYTKCLELDVPVCFQTGQSAEPLPSSGGRPMNAEQVAMDFPSLDIVLTHAGWPWTREWCSMLWRFPNVYGAFGAYYPSFLPDEQVEFMDGRLRDKVVWQTNGLGLERCKEEFIDLDIREETIQKVLRENAIDLFNLDV